MKKNNVKLIIYVIFIFLLLVGMIVSGTIVGMILWDDIGEDAKIFCASQDKIMTDWEIVHLPNGDTEYYVVCEGERFK